MPQPTILDVEPLIQDTTPPEPITPQPDPQPGFEPPPQDGQSAPEGGLEYRWRQERRPVPREVVDPFAQAIGAPDPQTALNWLQQGRDAAFHREQLELERQQLEDERRQLNALRGAGQQFGFPPMEQGAPFTGYPNPPQMPQPGGYPPGQWSANPQGYPQPGGYDPYPVPPPPPVPQPGQNARPEDVNQALLQYAQWAQMQSAQLAGIRDEIRRDREAAQRARVEIDAREQEVWLTRQADTYLDQVRSQGMDIPDAYTADHLIGDVNRYGLSQSQMPWLDAFETAVARRFWRQTRQAGAAQVAASLNDREASFRMPPARAAATTPAGDVPQGTSELERRALAARRLGEGVTVREALGHRQ